MGNRVYAGRIVPIHRAAAARLWAYRPEVKASEKVPRWACQELAKMGTIAAREMIMAAVASSLALWILASKIRVTTKEWIVTMDGLVPNETMKQMAERDAWYVLGVSEVIQPDTGRTLRSRRTPHADL